MNRRKNYLFALIITSLLWCSETGCGIYSYPSGTPFNKSTSVSVSNFTNHVKTQSSDINYKITEDLMNKLKQQEDLELVKDNGTIQIAGSIKDYQIEPFSVGQNNTVYLNRVKLVVRVKFTNISIDKNPNNKNLTAFIDYDAKNNFGTVRDSLNNLLSRKIANEIYNEFFIRW